LIDYFQTERWLLAVLNMAVMVVSVLVILEALSVISKYRRGEEVGSDQDAVADSGTSGD
ncbi:unnamed protein product, partial [Discosporangium mesarthrocarpum]